MKKDILSISKQILKNAKTILFVDWPDIDIPGSLSKAGFIVYGYSPDNYSEGRFTDDGLKLLFRKIDNPRLVGVVSIYRPENEHAAIVAKHVLPLKAKVIWLQPPIMSAKTAKMAKEHGLKFIEGIDIAEVTRML